MGRKTKSSLTDKQMRFIAEYLIDKNATQAAIRTGYSEKTARVQGSRLLTNADIQHEIQRQISADLKEFQIDRTTVLQELLRIATSDIRELFDENGMVKPVHSLSDEAARAISAIEVEETRSYGNEEQGMKIHTKKIKFWDKNKALENLARHLKLLTDKVEVEVNESLFDRMKRARERARKGGDDATVEGND
jgi:phage terminase small subunit